jgi:alpha-amylase/alpha-mannosidase (GH57 family)
MPRPELAIVWHLHQPLYIDPLNGKSVLPWVRLHASRSYYDFARVLPEHPGARVHLNVVPALLDQIELTAAGKARDPWLELTLRRAEDLTQVEREFVLRNFFMVAWETEVRPRPRYWELLQRRGTDRAHLVPAELARTARSFSAADLRDLQVLFNLAWTGFSLREEDPALAELLVRGSGYREEDKQVVHAAQQRALAAVVPQYRALSEAGQVELTSTPYYHPILPLLIDSDCAREGLPDRPMPQRFAYPEDAREQVVRARARHSRLFGRAPEGMWPAEGGVSPAAAAIFASAGTRWIASDEEVLWRSLPEGGAADRRQLYQPYRLETDGGPISMVFRDHGLSDRIGFVYARTPADEAVDDLLDLVRRAAPDVADPLISIILDGENPWEHYPDSGRDFLHRLFAELEDEDTGIQTVLLGRRLPTREHRPLSRLHAGSWVDANFRIWIGEAEDRAAWEALRLAREALERARAAGRPAHDLAVARDHLLVAEGSDWTWWFGGDFATDTPAEFDALFRNQLLAAYRALGEAPPRDLLQPISSAARGGEEATGRTEITGFIHPTIDGMVTRHGEWQGAGRLGAEVDGAMHQGSRPFSQTLFGFGTGALFIRLDPTAGVALPAGWELELEFQTNGVPLERLRWKPAAQGRSPVTRELGSGNLPAGSGCFRDIVELELELKALSLPPGARFDLAVRVMTGTSELQRFPALSWLDLTVPSPELERQIWKV